MKNLIFLWEIDLADNHKILFVDYLQYILFDLCGFVNIYLFTIHINSHIIKLQTTRNKQKPHCIIIILEEINYENS